MRESFAEHCTLTNDQLTRMRFINHLWRYSPNDCPSNDATQLTSVALRIPLEHSKLHFLLFFKVAITNLGNYIDIFSPQQWAVSWTIIYFFYIHWSMDGLTYICPWYSQHAPSPPLLFVIISYVDAPCLCNIKIAMTGTIGETKQKVTWSSAHQ